jgi:hypothetical protein
MLKNNQLTLGLKSLIILSLSSPIAQANNAILQNASPHFYVQMENQSNQPAFISFRQAAGNVSLMPILSDHTDLSAHQQSNKYGVVFDPIGKTDTFNIVFTGRQDCVFNIAFYAVNNPQINISGAGCFGGGYHISGNTLVLYISDIRLKA